MAQPVIDPFRLAVKPLPPARWLGYDTPGLLLGSCFATEIGSRLASDGFEVMVNPYGTAYNPITTLQSLQLTWAQVEQGLVKRDGGCVSLLLHSDIWSLTEEGLRVRFEERRQALSTLLAQAEWMSLTLGTAWVYTRKSDGLLCANLHKQPAGLFERRLLDLEEIEVAWLKAHAYLMGLGIRQFVVTVSPVIHGKDGLTENSLSKAVLRMAAERMASMPNVTYFPALEIVRDELRDYRFYAADMQHPSPQAADEVYGRFMEYALRPADSETVDRYRALAAFSHHRPNHIDPTLYRAKLQEVQDLPIPASSKLPLTRLLQDILAEK